MVHELLQLLNFHQLIQMITQSSIILSCVSSILITLAVKTLITLGWITSHLIGPFEIRLILDLLEDLIYQLLKH